MNPVKLVGESLRTAGSAMRFASPKHAHERDRLVADIRSICDRCETGYTTVLERLVALKATYGDRAALAEALRAFSSDDAARTAFRSDRLSGELDAVLQRLERDVDRVEYPVDFWRVYRLESALADPEDHERELREYYDDFAHAMEKLAMQLQSTLPDREPKERQTYARHIVEAFETDLRDTLRDIQFAREEVCVVA